MNKMARGNSTGNLVKLSDILKAENYTMRTGDYIRVNVVWRSDMEKDPEKCQFIFADESDHIAAILWLNINEKENKENQNTANKLEENTKWQISNFTVNAIGIENVLWRLVVSQKQQINLSYRSGDVIDISDEPTNFLTHIPFKFTPLKKLDEFQQGSYIDIIAFVSKIEEETAKVNGVKYEKVEVRSTRSSIRSQRQTKYLAVFGNNKKQITCKGIVYALMNAQVSYWDGCKSLKTVANTVILRMNEDNVNEKLPLEYLDQPFVMDLFAKKRGRKSNATENDDRSPPKPSTSKRARGGSEPSGGMSPNKSRRSL